MTKKKTDHDDLFAPSASSGQVLPKQAESQREAALEALRESEARFHIALKNSPIVFFNQDRELRYIWICNPHPGFDPQSVLGKTDAELLPADDAACLAEIKRRVLETGVTAREEVKTTIDGQAFFYDLTVEPLRDLSGNITGVTCASMDITERKRMELDIRLMSDTQRQIAHLDDITEIYQLVGKKIQELVGIGYVAISMLDEQIQAMKKAACMPCLPEKYPN